MTRGLVAVLSLLIGVAMLGAPASAHHGSQGYDLSGPRKTLRGTVTRFAWQNPHAQIYVDVKDDKGAVASWAMELNNPGNLVSLGWNHSSVKAGDEVTVRAGEEGIRFLLVSGRPIKEPVAWYGPIVMNTQDQIRQAIAELNSGSFIKEGSANVLQAR